MRITEITRENMRNAEQHGNQNREAMDGKRRIIFFIKKHRTSGRHLEKRKSKKKETKNWRGAGKSTWTNVQHEK